MKKKILIVEDNPINAELLQEMLDQLNIETKVLLNGREIFNTLSEDSFDLIFLDIMMPEISGYEIMEKITQSPYCQIPVLFISALSDSKDIIKGLELGSYDYITKPFKVDELKAKVQNILRIKELQDELKNGKETLEKIYNNSADAIITTTKDCFITSCSNSFAKLFNKSPEELQGESLCELLKNNDKNLNPKPPVDVETIRNNIKNLSLKNKFFETKVSEIKNSQNELDGYIFILRDISKTKEIEEQKESFIAALSHDLKTPVRAEIRAIELLLNGHFGELNEVQNEILQEILNSGNYMFSMIDSLLAKYKYDDNKIKLRKSFFSSNELITDCIKETKFLYEKKHQSINVQFENKNDKIFADFLEIKRTIQNLLTNAIKYSNDYSIIEVKLFEKNNALNISFIDNGPGISDEELEMIFNKFTSFSKKFRKAGSGLGLYISKQIAKMHGGDIFVESKEGSGSTFTLSIPITQIPAEAELRS